MIKNNSEKFLYKRIIDKQPELNIWFAFPAIYSFGMSSLGYLSIFKSLDESKEFNIERIFTDTKTTSIPLSKVDLIGFSCSFEIDFLAIFKIMEKYGIPFKSSERADFDKIIFAGGPVLTANPEPFAEFFDFILIGDGEDIYKDIIPVISKHKSLPKMEILKELSKIDGIYVPALKQAETKVKRRTSKLSACINTPILTDNTYFSNTYIIELARGCPMRCAFCLASYLNLPTRYAPYEDIVANIDFALEHTNKIAFLGALITAHPDFDKICGYVNKKIQAGTNVELSVSSLRADMISPTTVQTLVSCGQKHSTIAIEAGSDRLRKVINKNLTEKQILETVKTVYENGLKGLKVYVMIGLPTENEKDIEELVLLGKKIKENFKDFDLTFSFSTFVPKAQTPFQFTQREDIKSLEKKYNYLKKHLVKYGIKVRPSSPMWDYIQSVISRGDRQMADFLIEIYRQGGNIGAFKAAKRKYAKIFKSDYIDVFKQGKLDTESLLPWDFIEASVSKCELVAEYRRLLPNY